MHTFTYNPNFDLLFDYEIDFGHGKIHEALKYLENSYTILQSIPIIIVQRTEVIRKTKNMVNIFHEEDFECGL